MLISMGRLLPLTTEEIVERAERRLRLKEKRLLLTAGIVLVLNLLLGAFLLLLR